MRGVLQERFGFRSTQNSGMARSWLPPRSAVPSIGFGEGFSRLLAASKTQVSKSLPAGGVMKGHTWAWQPPKQTRSDIRRGEKLYREHMELVAEECEVEWKLRRSAPMDASLEGDCMNGETVRRTAHNGKDSDSRSSDSVACTARRPAPPRPVFGKVPEKMGPQS